MKAKEKKINHIGDMKEDNENIKRAEKTLEKFYRFLGKRTSFRWKVKRAITSLWSYLLILVFLIGLFVLQERTLETLVKYSSIVTGFYALINFHYLVKENKKKNDLEMENIEIQKNSHRAYVSPKTIQSLVKMDALNSKEIHLEKLEVDSFGGELKNADFHVYDIYSGSLIFGLKNMGPSVATSIEVSIGKTEKVKHNEVPGLTCFSDSIEGGNIMKLFKTQDAQNNGILFNKDFFILVSFNSRFTPEKKSEILFRVKVSKIPECKCKCKCKGYFVSGFQKIGQNYIKV